ncbi:MAG: hypothetical protein Q9219_006994 [cf. Caloplaca sp. 3 TL-2023]
MRLFKSFIASLALLGGSFPTTYSATFTPGPVTLSPYDTITLASIRQLISLFSISLDEKTFDALQYVYTEDALLDGGGGNSTLKGLPAIIDFYRTTFQNTSLKTEHTADTVYGYNFAETTAASSSYAEVAYFGPEIFERGGLLFSNSSVIFRERFDREYRKEASGAWKISRQTGPTLLSIEGDTSLLQPL